MHCRLPRVGNHVNWRRVGRNTGRGKIHRAPVGTASNTTTNGQVIHPPRRCENRSCVRSSKKPRARGLHGCKTPCPQDTNTEEAQQQGYGDASLFRQTLLNGTGFPKQGQGEVNEQHQRMQPQMRMHTGTNVPSLRVHASFFSPEHQHDEGSERHNLHNLLGERGGVSVVGDFRMVPRGDTGRGRCCR